MPRHNRIKGKVVLKGQIECLTPVHIGSGRAKYTDMDIIRDSNGNVFIPASSFIGVLRYLIVGNTKAKVESPGEFENFWGFTDEKDGQQSALCCTDLNFLENNSGKIITRDGICIDNKTGIVEKGGKFDFELIEPGNRFLLKMEFTYREEDEAFVKKTARTIYDLLKEEQIQIGAKTNNGLGRVRLVKNATKIYLFDFTHKTHVFHWMTQRFADDTQVSSESLGKPFCWQEKQFQIKATLRLKNSLIVRSYAGESKMPEACQLRSVDDWVIPGASLKGAIRSRAERIAYTILDEKAAQRIIDGLFGYLEDGLEKRKSDIKKGQQGSDKILVKKNSSKKAAKGRIHLTEIIMSPNDFPAELQTRIRVDRFSGGVIEGGLFDSMPVFAPKEEKTLEFQIAVQNYKDYEVGLLLLVLKDLWSGDLAVGGEKNIGRGIFEGVGAEITWGNEKIIIDKDITLLSDEKKTQLENFVTTLTGERS